MENKKNNADSIYKNSDNDLNLFLEDLSPFYSENPIEDIGMIEFLSRFKKSSKY